MWISERTRSTVFYTNCSSQPTILLTATSLANQLQTELTEQRKYSDDLRSQIRNMEDWVDALKKGNTTPKQSMILSHGNALLYQCQNR